MASVRGVIGHKIRVRKSRKRGHCRDIVLIYNIRKMPPSTFSDDTVGKPFRFQVLGFPARVGQFRVGRSRNWLALAGGRTRRCLADFAARFGVHADELWTSCRARFGGGKTVEKTERFNTIQFVHLAPS